MDMLAWLISELLEIYTIVVFANALLSWFVFRTQNSVVRQLYWWTKSPRGSSFKSDSECD